MNRSPLRGGLKRIQTVIGEHQMPGEIYVVITGNENEFWPVCLDRDLVAMGFETPYFDAWRAGDYEAYLELERGAAVSGTPEADVRARATLWFNRATTLSQSEGDLWLHRAENDLYWTESTEASPTFEPTGGGQVMIGKSTTRWSNRDRRTVPLRWDSIHPKAKDFLVSQQALFRVANEDMRKYLAALVAGADLSPWHGRPEWKARLGGRSLVKYMPVADLAIARMMDTMRATIANASGQIVQRTLKDKKLLCSEAEMLEHIRYLIELQEGICRLTGLRMHLDNEDGVDRDMLVSLDRIDSDGHYDIGNVQLVCRFANFWKSSQSNGRFLELLERILESRSQP